MNDLYRPELDVENMPEGIQALPVDRGYPIPWFVDWLDGKPEFRSMDQKKWVRAWRERLCWVCGGKMGRYFSFVLGPMCGVTKTTSEPPCHKACAEWSAKNCPFLARPHMERREGDEVAEMLKGNVAGFAIRRNPGVALVWTTTSYDVFDDGNGRPLIQVGEPISLSWYAEGRDATREEVEKSVKSGLPILEQASALDTKHGAAEYLAKELARLETWYPVPDEASKRPAGSA